MTDVFWLLLQSNNSLSEAKGVKLVHYSYQQVVLEVKRQMQQLFCCTAERFSLEADGTNVHRVIAKETLVPTSESIVIVINAAEVFWLAAGAC